MVQFLPDSFLDYLVDPIHQLGWNGTGYVLYARCELRFFKIIVVLIRFWDWSHAIWFRILVVVAELSCLVPHLLSLLDHAVVFVVVLWDGSIAWSLLWNALFNFYQTGLLPGQACINASPNFFFLKILLCSDRLRLSNRFYFFWILLDRISANRLTPACILDRWVADVKIGHACLNYQVLISHWCLGHFGGGIFLITLQALRIIDLTILLGGNHTISNLHLRGGDLISTLHWLQLLVWFFIDFTGSLVGLLF